jgi:hypothetical protein
MPQRHDGKRETRKLVCRVWELVRGELIDDGNVTRPRSSNSDVTMYVELRNNIVKICRFCQNQ